MASRSSCFTSSATDCENCKNQMLWPRLEQTKLILEKKTQPQSNTETRKKTTGIITRKKEQYKTHTKKTWISCVFCCCFVFILLLFSCVFMFILFFSLILVSFFFVCSVFCKTLYSLCCWTHKSNATLHVTHCHPHLAPHCLEVSLFCFCQAPSFKLHECLTNLKIPHTERLSKCDCNTLRHVVHAWKLIEVFSWVELGLVCRVFLYIFFHILEEFIDLQNSANQIHENKGW